MIIRTALCVILLSSIALYSSTITNKKVVKTQKKFHKNSSFPHKRQFTDARGCSIRGSGKNKQQGELHDHIRSECIYVHKEAAIRKAQELSNQRSYDYYCHQ